MSQHFHVDVVQPGPAVELLTEASGLSKQKIKSAMKKGAIWLDEGKGFKRLRRASKVLSSGSQLDFYFNPEVLAEEPTPAELIADHKQYSVWFKPRGMFSQGSKWGDHCTLQRWAEQHLEPQRPAFIVHRLDRATSGLMLLAHTKKMAQRLSAMFESRGIHKTYLAKVTGNFPKMKQSYHNPLDGKTAVSHVMLVTQFDTEALIKIRIETGRKHQIRRHLAGAGYPLIGDRLHGFSETEEDLALVAYQLNFECPITGETLSFSLTPNRLENLFNIQADKLDI